MRRWLMLAALLLVPVAGQAQTIEYYGLDAIGSVRVVFDANGNVLSRADYAPFGEALFPATGKQQQVYAGLFAEGEAGFDYAEARMYQPRTGRFNAVDPVYAGLFQPQAWNRYVYVSNTPTAFVDTTGLQRNQGLCTPDITKINSNDWHCIPGLGPSPFAVVNPNPADGPGGPGTGGSHQDDRTRNPGDVPRPTPPGPTPPGPTPPGTPQPNPNEPPLTLPLERKWLPPCAGPSGPPGGHRIEGNVGFIHVQSSYPGNVAWGANLYTMTSVGLWTVTEVYTNSLGKRESNKMYRVYGPHGSHGAYPNKPGSLLQSGSIFDLQVQYELGPFFASGRLSCIVP